MFKCKSGATNGFVWKWSTPKVHKNQKSVVYHHCGESKILERNQLCVCSGVMVLSFATSNHQILFWKFEETVLRWTSNPFLLSAMSTASSHIGNLFAKITCFATEPARVDPSDLRFYILSKAELRSNTRTRFKVPDRHMYAAVCSILQMVWRNCDLPQPMIGYYLILLASICKVTYKTVALAQEVSLNTRRRDLHRWSRRGSRKMMLKNIPSNGG